MTLALKDMQLLRSESYIDGRWMAALSKAVFPVSNPASGQTIVEVANMGAAETQLAIDAAHRAWPAWRCRMGAVHRGQSG